MTLLYEIHSIKRFSTVQSFSSYARTVKAQCQSAGKKVGKGDDKIGNPTLNWVFHEIAGLLPRYSPVISTWYEKLKKRKGVKCAKAILIHKISVAVYYMLKRKETFDENRFIGIYPHTANRSYRLDETVRTEKQTALFDRSRVPLIQKKIRSLTSNYKRRSMAY